VTEARERALFAWVVEREGSAFTDHPLDKGGPTRWGITAAALAEDRGVDLQTAALQVAALSEASARDFYRRKYVDHPHLVLREVRPFAAALVVMDGAVLFGRTRAARWAQEATRGLLNVDGRLGPVSRAAIEAVDRHVWLARVQAFRADRHVDRCLDEPSQLVFLKGWLRRTCHLAEALRAPDLA
jgi:lysozyme family protein